MNLTEARRLHDRDPDQPNRCRICCHTEGDDWPCATARALGATGRSEWEDEPASPRNGYPAGDCDMAPDCTGPLDHPGACTPPWLPCGMYSTRDQGSHGPCERDSTHDHGPHRDAKGEQW